MDFVSCGEGCMYSRDENSLKSSMVLRGGSPNPSPPTQKLPRGDPLLTFILFRLELRVCVTDVPEGQTFIESSSEFWGAPFLFFLACLFIPQGSHRRCLPSISLNTSTKSKDVAIAVRWTSSRSLQARVEVKGELNLTPISFPV